MILLRIGLLLVLAGIAYLSLSPSPGVSVGNDKVGHFIAYATLMFNLGLLFFSDRKKLVFALVFALCYGALMEWGQSFVPGRTTSLHDMVANAMGVTIGLVLTLLFGAQIHRILSKSIRK